ncbi:MAG: undecaprenyldiphospho-muramoylpentapeptide beta-N-acetylglucosaminyltransferase [Chloroflexi bacterium]|nr:undecaprenyldiphospho-muramoylpentapeptide beta-N-acetylglucosaminyltransferase [Chloroflexota bacterium]
MRLLICAGGTGGGVYPAAAVLQAASASNTLPLETLWVGGQGGMEADLVARLGVTYQSIPAAGVHGVSLLRLPGNLWKLFQGWLASRRILREFKPDVLLLTGGYLAVPMAIAARRVPTLLYVPDIEPGLALKTLARFADRIAVTADDSRAFFQSSAPIVETGYPTRPELAAWDRAAALQHLGLSTDSPVVLVFGGSKGARSINRALLAILEDLLDRVQVVHISGSLDWEEVQAARQNLPAHLQPRYHAFPYLHEDMGAALASADLVVSRAGASSLGEYPLFGLPAILVPYPYAWRYQKVNAEYLASRGAALLLRDEHMPQQLRALITQLLDDPQKLQAMRAAMRSLALPNPAQKISSLLSELAGEKPISGGEHGRS